MDASEAVQDGLWPEPKAYNSGREAKEHALEVGWPLRLRFRGRAVPERLAVDACRLVQVFGRCSGQTTPRFLSDGAPSEALKRVLGALTSHPEVTFDSWLTTVQEVLAHPWWGSGPASIGAVFGPKVVDDNLLNPSRGHSLTASERRERARMERTAKRLATIRAATA